MKKDVFLMIKLKNANGKLQLQLVLIELVQQLLFQLIMTLKMNVRPIKMVAQLRKEEDV